MNSNRGRVGLAEVDANILGSSSDRADVGFGFGGHRRKRERSAGGTPTNAKAVDVGEGAMASDTMANGAANGAGGGNCNDGGGMNVWASESIVEAALAEESGGGSGGGRGVRRGVSPKRGRSPNRSFLKSASELSSKASFDAPTSSRRAEWTWVESEVVAGSAQGLMVARSPGNASGGGRSFGLSSSSRSDAPQSEEGLLTLRIVDQDSEHAGKTVSISRRHLSAAPSPLGRSGSRGNGNGNGSSNGGVLPANHFPPSAPLPHDLAQLTHLHEPAVVDCLRRRYAIKTGWEMYTSSGPILIAINPCRTVPGLYDDEAAGRYWRRGERLAGGRGPGTEPSTDGAGGTGEATAGAGGSAADDPPPPHVFGVADAAYRGMMRGLDFARGALPEEEKKEESGSQAGSHVSLPDDVLADQSVLVSGESGAGKTVTTRFIMQYLAALSKKADARRRSADAGGTGDRSSIEQRVLQSNAILEAFGNARTLRNDNSSRFGKFIELRFSPRGRLAGASVDTYLLEKARIVGHASGERTYHVFYEVLAKGSLSAADRRRFHVHNAAPADFAATTADGGRNRSGLMHNEYDDHAKMFGELTEAMTTMGTSKAEQSDIFRTVCGLLHLSNLARGGAFAESSDGEECALDESNPSLKPALDLFGVTYDDLNAAVTTVRFQAAGEMVKKNLTAAQASRAVQALIKGCYDAVFSLLVDRINARIAGTGEEGAGDGGPGGVVGRREEEAEGGAFIGLLDIFGFESFETNSFEQLCINYCNESLQQQFNRFVFKLEQQEYKREGIKWDMIEFEDNQDILDLIERRHGGILTILDEQCKLGMRCNDRTFVAAVYNKCSETSDRFDATKKQKSQGKFSIQHYAGIVEYDTAGFMEKNKDEIPMEASELFSNSSCPFVQDIALVISSKMNGDPRESKRKALKSSISRVSVGGQFASQLQRLRRRIDGTHPHYVRCLKPNDRLEPGKFDPNIVVDQLRCGGILEAIRVSRAGFPHRYTFDHFDSRFSVLLPALSSSVVGGRPRPPPQRRVGKLNIGNRGGTPAKPTAKKAIAPRKQRSDPKKSCEVLVKAIARWVMAEREKSKVADQDTGVEDTPAHDALSPRSFWKSQSPNPKSNRGTSTSVHKPTDTSEAGIQLGTTKVFLLQDTFDCIERLRGQVLATSATKISSLVRGHLARRAYLAILIAYRESLHRRSLGGGNAAASTTPLLRSRSEDGSVLRQVDVNLEVFESKSSFERANSFAKPEPQEFEWVSVGHGRFAKRESTRDLDPDYVSHELNNSDYVDF
ncbi:hypothetical protein ACHAWF_017340 [Thalassiosira exigua]